MAATVPPSTVDSLQSTSVFTALNINKPDTYAKLVQARGDQGLEYFDLLKMLGYVMPVSQEKVTHFEDDWSIESFNNLNTVTQNAAGANIVIRLSPNNLDANNKFYPRQWDVVMFPNNVKGQIISIAGAGTSTVDLTIKPLKVGQAIGTVNAGQELIIYTNAFSEGSDQPDGVFSKTRQFDVYTQILKETFNLTGSAGTNSTWFEQMSDDTGLTYYRIKGQKDMDYRMKQKIYGALMFGETSDNNIVDANTGFTIQTTDGLDPYIRNNGNTVNYTIGTWSLKKFDETTKILDREFAPNTILTMMGPDFSKENENALVDFQKNTNISYSIERVKNTYFNGDDGLYTKVGFSMLEKSGRDYAFKTLKVLDHQKLTGAAGYTFPSNFYMVPLGMGKDTKTKEGVPYIGMIYKKLGNDDRMMTIWDQRGAGPEPSKYVLSKDIANYYMRGHIGARQMAGNQMIIGLPS